MRWILLNVAVLTASAAPPILHSSFEDGLGGWVAMGQSGTLRATQEPSETHNGRPSLAIHYEIGQKKFTAAVLPVEPGALGAMGQIHFWIKTDLPTSVVLTLRERDGGNYFATAWSPGSDWQEVKLAARDFALSNGPNDPLDPDGKLDLDQVQGIALADLAQLFADAKRNPDMPIAVADRSGEHTLLMNGFEVFGGDVPGASDNLAIDKFDAPQLSWMSPGGATFRLDDSRAHAPGPAMEVDYTQAAHALVYFVRNLPPNIPASITHISFDIASEKASQFVFTLQERGSGHGEGPRYNTVVEVKGKGRGDHRDLALSAFNFDRNGPPDPNGALRIANVKSLAIADVSAATNGDSGPNRFWISNIRLVSLQ